MAVYNFNGATGVAPVEVPFRCEDPAVKASIPTTMRPSATEWFLENTDAANSLSYSLDCQATWTTLTPGASTLMRTRIRNGRNSAFIQQVGGLVATYAGYAVTEG